MAKKYISKYATMADFEDASRGQEFALPNVSLIDDTKAVVFSKGYIPTNGIWIKYTDGTFSAYNVLDSGKTPVGVALITDNVKLLLHPTETSDIGGVTGTFSGCFSTTNSTLAKTDFGGKTNTEAILAVNPNAAPEKMAHNAVYADGSIGWLPSAGECKEMAAYATEINVALDLIGGDELTDFHHCSTKAGSTALWIIAVGSTSSSSPTMYSRSSGQGSRVRSVTSAY